MCEQFPRLAELLLARGALKQVVHAVDMLVVKQVRWLHEALVTEVALKRPIGGVFVSAPVANQRILLLEAHLTLVTVERALLRVRTLVLTEVRWPLETFSARSAAERAGTLRVAGMMQQLRRLLEV